MSAPQLLFLCTGNICRSPSAHAVFLARWAEQVRREPALAALMVDSAATVNHHEGELPDRRASAEGRRRGYAVDHVARQLRAVDQHRPGLIVAMDRGHLRWLDSLSGWGPERPAIRLLRSFDPAAPRGAELEDPYYGPDSGFSLMFDQIEEAMPGLLFAARGLVR